MKVFFTLSAAEQELAELRRSHTDELERLQEAQRLELEQTIQKHREHLEQLKNQVSNVILLEKFQKKTVQNRTEIYINFLIYLFCAVPS